jgi:hypothetical protein
LFPNKITYLQNLRKIEGLEDEEGCIGHSPFTGFFVSRDYDCDLYDDQNDHSYGFIIWLGKEGE